MVKFLGGAKTFLSLLDRFANRADPEGAATSAANSRVEKRFREWLVGNCIRLKALRRQRFLATRRAAHIEAHGAPVAADARR